MRFFAQPIAVLTGALFLGIVPSRSEDSSDRHWAYRAIAKPAKDATVDTFIERRLEENGLERNPPADRYTLLRRITLDLTGLPPTRDELAAFIDDDSPDTWAKTVDRLLASPHYGERWGRHWLDLARYVQGTIKVPGVDRLDLAEPYRDYVVRAFNSDKPYDRFLTEQIAGDLLADNRDYTDDAGFIDASVAPAFLSIGPWFDECTDPNKLRLDIIDEQISTLTKAFLAHDFACARCHDHKTDPIPTRDYYALAGIFRSTEITSRFSEEWRNGRPRLTQPIAQPALLDQRESATARRDAIRSERFAFLSNARDELLASADPGRRKAALAAARERIVAEIEAEDHDGQKELRAVSVKGETIVETRRANFRWIKYYVDLPPEPTRYHLQFRYASVDDASVSIEVNGKTLPSTIPFPASGGLGPDHFRWTQPFPVELPATRVLLRFKVSPHETFPRLDRFRLVRLATETGSETDPFTTYLAAWPPTVAEMESLLDPGQREQLDAIDTRLAAAESAIPDLPEALAVRETARPVDLPVHVGGAVYRTGEELVPRGVPTLAGHLVPRPSPRTNSSGRLALAEWLADERHPITARVWANRIWQWHFGTGLVRTSDDFGATGARPTHPELLDYLAHELITSGWSTKHLHRLILNSETYRASAQETIHNLERDADGSLLSRYPRRRLEAEAIYDSLLTVSGEFSPQSAGEPLDTEESKDRALYVLISARSPMGLGIEIRKMLRLFGFDDSGRPMHDRDDAVTASQSLWWLNNPLPRHFADLVAENLVSEFDEPGDRAEALFETVLGRPPESAAHDALLDYVSANRTAGLDDIAAWSRACLGLFCTDSFSHLE